MTDIDIILNLWDSYVWEDELQPNINFVDGAGSLGHVVLFKARCFWALYHRAHHSVSYAALARKCNIEPTHARTRVMWACRLLWHSSYKKHPLRAYVERLDEWDKDQPVKGLKEE